MSQRASHPLEVPATTGLREVPGPRAWPIIGDPAGLRAARDLLRFYEGYWHRYGDIYRVPMFGMSMLVITHPDAIKHVLWTKRQNYIKGSGYDGARRVMGDSLLTLDGDAWKGRRNVEQPAFHRQSIEKLTAHMVSSGARFFDRLLARARGGALEIDAHREMVKLTLDVVVRALFGQAMQGSTVSYETLSEALDLVSAGANRFVLPAWVPTPHNRKLHRTLAELDRTMYAFIATAREQGLDDSLLSMLLAARDEHGEALSDRAIRNEVMTLFIAGHETTALALTWMFTLLADQPAIVERMQREVDTVLGDRDPGYADVSELRYLRQVVDETLRLRPPAPMVARNAVADDSIDGYRVRAGEMVLPFFWATHRHPQFWKDPLRFDPERFDPARPERQNSWSYVPFSAGPRVCIGNMFSLVESVLLLAQLLRRFTLEIAPCNDVRPIALATARPSRPVRVTLRPRFAS
jgi:cytochrome P450